MLRGRLSRRTSAVVLALAVGALSACGTPDGAREADGELTAEAGDAGSPDATATPDPTESATAPAVPVSDPDGATPAEGARCQPSQLVAEAGFVDAATGYRQTGVTVTNVSELTCTLDGFPGVDAIGTAGSDLDVIRTDGVWNDPAAAEPRTVTLAPGDAAQALVGWRGDQVGTWDGEQYRDELTGRLQLVLDGSADGPGVGVAFTEPADLPLDIVDGQEVRTSSWRPVTDPAPATVGP